ncbi:MAG: DUF4298 domain-containing protein [Lachnospiraceae bacterium]|nr:DUF4298 domain-containing protein [Lachnospiraceae bacterium]
MTNVERIKEMEAILDEAVSRMDELEEAMSELEAYQRQIEKLEKYYTSNEWKDDLATDEEGSLQANLKRGVLSEDGIYNVLERNRELLELIRENREV